MIWNSIPTLTRDGNRRFIVVKIKNGTKIYSPTTRAYEILFGLPPDYTKELGSNFKRTVALGNSFDVNIVASIFKAINDSLNGI